MAKDKKSKSIRQVSGKRPVYETPVIVRLGEVARGHGICASGSNPTPGPILCTVGPSPGISGSCAQGFFAGSGCANGVLG